MERLINMTHSMEHCQFAYEAHDDESLGKFYAENRFVTQLDSVPDNIYAWLDLMSKVFSLKSCPRNCKTHRLWNRGVEA